MVAISFIIPAYNERTFIARTLEHIHRFGGGAGSYEIILCDHGSSDDTVTLAQEGGARVIQPAARTVGELRNEGARAAKGEVLVFLDADVFLTAEWARRFPGTVRFLQSHPRTITGSWIGLPPAPSWIERWWFGPLVHRRNTHINSGHMIVGRRYFEQLGGFDVSYETGEDYELSKRAESSGGKVIEDPALNVEHHGFPRTLRQFIRREAWHGLADFKSLRRIATSRVALLTCLFLALHSFALMTLILPTTRPLASSAVVGIAALCGGASLVKYGLGNPAATVINAVIYYFYFAGRSIAFFRALRSREISPHSRATTAK